MRFVGQSHHRENNIYDMSASEHNRLERIFSLIACHAQLLYPESNTHENKSTLAPNALETERDEAILAITGIVLILAFGLLLWVCAVSGNNRQLDIPLQQHISSISSPVAETFYNTNHQTLAAADELETNIIPPMANTSSWQLDPDQAEVLAPFAQSNRGYYLQQ